MSSPVGPCSRRPSRSQEEEFEEHRRKEDDIKKGSNNKVGNNSELQTSQEGNSAGSHYPANPPFSPNHGLQPGRPAGALLFTMAELNKVTGNFSESHRIGAGGFGTVYQGKLRDGTVVAIKRARKESFETRVFKEFQTEVDMLSQVEHLNLVRLIGYLEEKNERILVTEYVTNGNLRQHLDGTPYGVNMDMATRLDIAIDVAHALTYLHYYTDRPIIHRDVKSSNILITDTFRAKVADFGFSRAGPSGDGGATHVSTQVKGTAGYLDPEYLTTYQLNVKSDVYSFGILLVELFTGRRPIELKRPSDERVTVRWAFKKFVEGRLKLILDPKIEITSAVMGILDRLFELAFSCSAPTKGDRPSMKEAQELLWNIRKDYQAAVNQHREGLEVESMDVLDYPETARTPRGGRGGSRPHGARLTVETESVKARSSRRSEDNSRNPSSRGSHDNHSNRGSHENPSNRGSHAESVRTRRSEDRARTPRRGSPEHDDNADDIPSVQPIHVPTHRHQRRSAS